jgi:hypothetical protein
MHQVFRRLSEPPPESHVGMALGLAAVVIALMLCAIIWQANVIAYQRELIRLLSISGSGGAA